MPLYAVYPFTLIPPTFNNYTGGQSVSFVLLWQPSEVPIALIYLWLIIFLCYSWKFLENKYDDDDDDDDDDLTIWTVSDKSQYNR